MLGLLVPSLPLLSSVGFSAPRYLCRLLRASPRPSDRPPPKTTSPNEACLVSRSALSLAQTSSSTRRYQSPRHTLAPRFPQPSAQRHPSPTTRQLRNRPQLAILYPSASRASSYHPLVVEAPAHDPWLQLCLLSLSCCRAAEAVGRSTSSLARSLGSPSPPSATI